MMRGFSLASPVDHHGYKIVLKRTGRKPEPGCAASGEAPKKEKQKKSMFFKKPSCAPRPQAVITRPTERGRSSGVEHNLAKVGVVGSNPIARSR